jgi:3-hydroxyacyl-[acyl-carrier-protein] dehydratase
MLDFEEVKKYLPQQFPMLMVDRVLTYEKGKAITAIKNVTGNELFFQGHFPEKAIMPGAFILEGLGQCSVILFQLTYGLLQKNETPLFGSVEGRFLNPAFPGDQLRYEVEAVKMTSTAGIFKGIAKVEDQIVAKCELTFGKQNTEDS